RIALRRVGIFGPLLFLRRRIRALGVQRIFDGRFQRFVMGRQRTVFQSARNVQPADAIWVQRKWPRTTERRDSESNIQFGWSSGSKVFLVIRIVEPRPVFVCLVPPDQFLALAPRFSIRTRRCAVINDAAIVRPREPPAVTEQVRGFTLIGAIAILL